MSGLCLSDVFLERADGFLVIPGGNRRDRRLERTGFLDALSFHVFEKLRPDFCLFDEVENGLRFGLIDCSAGSVIVIAVSVRCRA
jgi:hypothetical protein